jgi:hypothetical protein
MSACLNCGTKLSCGCQKRVASDKKSVCGTCLSSYEASLKSGIPYTPVQKINPKSKVFRKPNSL